MRTWGSVWFYARIEDVIHKYLHSKPFYKFAKEALGAIAGKRPAQETHASQRWHQLMHLLQLAQCLEPIQDALILIYFIATKNRNMCSEYITILAWVTLFFMPIQLQAIVLKIFSSGGKGLQNCDSSACGPTNYVIIWSYKAGNDHSPLMRGLDFTHQ